MEDESSVHAVSLEICFYGALRVAGVTPFTPSRPLVAYFVGHWYLQAVAMK